MFVACKILVFAAGRSLINQAPNAIKTLPLHQTLHPKCVGKKAIKANMYGWSGGQLHISTGKILVDMSVVDHGTFYFCKNLEFANKRFFMFD